MTMAAVDSGSKEHPAVSARRTAELLKAVGVPARLKAVMALRKGEQTAGALAAAMGRSLPGASNHLVLLRLAGVVDASKVGMNRVYRLTELGERLARLAEAAAGPSATRAVSRGAAVR